MALVGKPCPSFSASVPQLLTASITSALWALSNTEDSSLKMCCSRTGALQFLKGEPTDIPAKGKPTVVELWATWCATGFASVSLERGCWYRALTQFSAGLSNCALMQSSYVWWGAGADHAGRYFRTFHRSRGPMHSTG